jgi:hypothetical protein
VFDSINLGFDVLSIAVVAPMDSTTNSREDKDHHEVVQRRVIYCYEKEHRGVILIRCTFGD